MANHSFFHLTNHADHTCITPRELAWLEQRDYMDSLSEAERASVFEEACTLANLLYRRIHTYSKMHDGTAYGVIVEALDLVQARITMELHDDTPDPDDCDA